MSVTVCPIKKKALLSNKVAIFIFNNCFNECYNVTLSPNYFDYLSETLMS